MDVPKAEAWLVVVVTALAKAPSLGFTLGFLGQAQGAFKEGWKVDDFFGHSTKFTLKLLGALQAAGAGEAKALCAKAGGLDVRALAECDEALLKPLIDEQKIDL